MRDVVLAAVLALPVLFIVFALIVRPEEFRPYEWLRRRRAR